MLDLSTSTRLSISSATALIELTVKSAKKSALASEDLPVIDVIAIDFKVLVSFLLTFLDILSRSSRDSLEALR